MTYPYLFSSSLTLLTVRVGLSVMHSLPISFCQITIVWVSGRMRGEETYTHIIKPAFPPAATASYMTL